MVERSGVKNIDLVPIDSRRDVTDAEIDTPDPRQRPRFVRRIEKPIMVYDDMLERMTFFASTITKLFGACGAFAILLAVTGIYGMSSNSVLLRSHEIGLRRALGASNDAVVATFVAQALKQLARGLGVSALLCAGILFLLQRGFSLGYWAMAMLAGGVVLVVSACVLLSIYLAVRRVIRLEPSAALRVG